jgi:hypothetical protein
MNTPTNSEALPLMNCSAVEVKDWTATDAQNALMMIDKNGRRFQVNAIGWDGTVHVSASDTIKPDQRDGWRLFVIQHNVQAQTPTTGSSADTHINPSNNDNTK